MLGKIVNYSDLSSLSRDFKRNFQTIVLVTGVFDLLHHAHLKFLKKAKAIADILIVGLESDARVRNIKGEGRPIIKLLDRVDNLLKTGIVDFVFSLPEKFDSPETHEDLIRKLKPDFLAVSSHTPFLDKKRQLIEKYAGKLIVVMERDKSISTTQILKTRIKKSS